jgi:hypothetical protein
MSAAALVGIVFTVLVTLPLLAREVRILRRFDRAGL